MFKQMKNNFIIIYKKIIVCCSWAVYDKYNNYDHYGV